MKAELNFVLEEPSIAALGETPDLEIDYGTVAAWYQNSFIHREYNDYLKGKSVVLVGPANYLAGESQGKYIESFDVIVRLNRSYPVAPADVVDIGSRTDIWYHNMNENLAQGGPVDVTQMEQTGVRFLSTHFPKHLSYFDNDIRVCEQKVKGSSVSFHSWSDLEQFVTLYPILNTRPNIGVGAILDLLNYDIKNLHVLGITFFQGGYLGSYLSRDEDLVPLYNEDKVPNHIQRTQRQLIKLLGENEKRLTFDKHIQNILWK
jgi:hypothetical protein